jgi:hypothetical protein
LFSLFKLFGDRLKFNETLGTDLGIAKVHALKGLYDDLRDNKPGVQLVVCRNDKPWRNG